MPARIALHFCLLGVLLNVVSFSPAWADPRYLLDSRLLKFENHFSDAALSHPFVTSIVQDHLGYVWIGTQEGLNRFDGYSFENSELMHSKLLRSGIRELFVDSYGDVWVGTERGLVRITGSINSALHVNDKVQWQEIQLTPDQQPTVYSITQSDSTTFWIGTSEGLFTVENGTVRLIKDKSIGRVRALLSQNDVLWIGSEGEGLLKLDLATLNHTSIKRDRTRTLVLKDSYIRELSLSKDGRLLIATFNGGVSVYNHSANEVTYLSYGERPSVLRTRALNSLSDGTVLIGTDEGLIHLDLVNKAQTQYLHSKGFHDSLLNDSVTSVFEDRSGVIWIGTMKGISLASPSRQKFSHYDSSIVGEEEIYSFAALKEGVVVGSSAGLVFWDLNEGSFERWGGTEIGLSDQRVMTLLPNEEDLWVGTMAGGVHLVRNGKSYKNYRHDSDDESSLSSNAISKIFKDSAGRIWVTTFGEGINLFQGDSFLRYPLQGMEFSDLRCTDIVEVEPGELWIATDGGGIVVLNVEESTTKFIQSVAGDIDGIQSNRVFHLLRTAEGVWVGTLDQGVSFIDLRTKRVQSFSTDSGLSSNAIYGFLEDASGHLWISGGRGLDRLDRKAGEVTSFSSFHGLQDGDFNGGAYLAYDSMFLFGGNNGFNVFNPLSVEQSDYQPTVVINRITLDNSPKGVDRKFSSRGELILNHDDDVIGLSFLSFDFANPGKNRFKYRLEGFDSKWVPSGTRNDVTFTNLPSGWYKFEVQGTNSDGVWSGRTAGLPIRVLPPPWLTWWAFTIYTLLTAFMLYAVLRFSAYRIEIQAERDFNHKIRSYIQTLEQTSDCVVIGDARSRILFINEAVNKVIGKSGAETLGHPTFDILFPRRSQRRRAERFLGMGEEHREEVLYEHLDGTEVIAEVTISPIEDWFKDEASLVAVIRDITTRKKAEIELRRSSARLERLVEEKSEQVANQLNRNTEIRMSYEGRLRKKDELLDAINHRVRSNMQLIAGLLELQSRNADSDSVSREIESSQQRVEVTALMHESLYDSKDFVHIDFHRYAESLVSTLCRKFQRQTLSISYEIDIQPNQMDVETAMPCALILNELVTNSLVHGYQGRVGPGELTVRLRKQNYRYFLTYHDDGVGLPEGFKMESDSKLGIEVINLMTEQLAGEIKFVGGNGSGIELSFPR